MFIYLVIVFNKIQGRRILMMIFYLAVLFAGFSSIINLYEAPVAYIEERFKLSRQKAAGIVNITGLIIAICIQGIVDGWMDFHRYGLKKLSF